MTIIPGVCTQPTNTYNVVGLITFTNPPLTGTLIVSVGAISQVFNSPFISPQAYNLNSLPADGLSHTITALFSAAPICSGQGNYLAQKSCNFGSIGDYVWTDTNNDGQQTSGEAPIAGIKVYLLNASGVK